MNELLHINLLSPELITETKEIVKLNSIYKQNDENIAEGSKIYFSVYSKKTVQDSIYLHIVPFRIKIPRLLEGESEQKVLRATYLSYVNEITIQDEAIRMFMYYVNNVKKKIDASTDENLKKELEWDLNHIDESKTTSDLRNIIKNKYSYWEMPPGGNNGTFKDFDNDMVEYFKNLGINTNIETLKLIIKERC